MLILASLAACSVRFPSLSDAPLASNALAAARRRAAALLVFGILAVAIPMSAFALLPPEALRVPFLSLALSLFPFLGVCALLGSCALDMLAPIPRSHCAELLDLCRRHPELAAWRDRLVEHGRPFIRAELLMFRDASVRLDEASDCRRLYGPAD